MSEGNKVILSDESEAMGTLVSSEHAASFDPKKKHAAEAWEGTRNDRNVVTAYTARGVPELSRPERDALWSCGFPIGKESSNLATTDFKAPKNYRPKKSIWKSAQKASALFTLGLAAATSYLSENMPQGHAPGQATIFEVGGYERTCLLAENGSSVVEPMSWEDFLAEDITLKAQETISVVKPHVVWVQGYGKGVDAVSRILRIARHQLDCGGTFVYQDSPKMLYGLHLVSTPHPPARRWGSGSTCWRQSGSPRRAGRGPCSRA